MADKTECVKVVIRLRPFNSKDPTKDRAVEMDRSLGQVIVTNPKAGHGELPKTFTYDTVFPHDSSQELIYNECAHPIVSSVLSGYNGTIFAYGQTGTGKTFTMEGDIDSDELKGITPRSFEQIMDFVNNSPATHLVRASFLEIYQDHVFDLLAKPKPRGHARDKLTLKENVDTGFYVKDLKVEVVKDAGDLYRLLQTGKSHRAVGATAMNAGSSRSHCIFSITVETSEEGEDGKNHIRVGKLNLVDLAGSERLSKTHAEGVRAIEATKINLALSALGNVISALTSKRKNGYTPYRDSKLTKLLQDSLGGNTKTAMIANIGPASYNYDETINTLRFATRAKTIKNKPKVNEDPKHAMLREFQEEIARLKRELEARNGQGGVGSLPGIKHPAQHGKVVVEKVVKKVVARGVRPEELEKAKEQAEREKRELEARRRQELEETRRQAGDVERKAQMIKEKVDLNRNLLAQQRQDKEALRNKLAEINAKLLSGASILSKAEKQKQSLVQKQEELKLKQLDYERTLRLKKQKEEQQLHLVDRYDSQAQELEAVNQKLEKLRTRYQQVKQEIEDVQVENQKEREDMLETIRELRRSIQLKDVILQHFVPFEEHDKVETRAFWDEEKDAWVLTALDLRDAWKMRRPKSAFAEQVRPMSEFARVAGAMGDKNPRFRAHNIIEPELDMPERTTEDYIVAPTDDQFADVDEMYYTPYGTESEYDGYTRGMY